MVVTEEEGKYYVRIVDNDIIAQEIEYRECAFEWWEEHKFMYPLLHLVASMMLIIKPSSVQCERIFSKCARFLTKYRAALEVGTLDSCVFLDRSPFLFEKALDVVSRKWKGNLKDTRKKQPTRISKDTIQKLTCDWNFIFNGPEVVVSDKDNIEDE